MLQFMYELTSFQLLLSAFTEEMSRHLHSKRSRNHKNKQTNKNPNQQNLLSELFWPLLWEVSSKKQGHKLFPHENGRHKILLKGGKNGRLRLGLQKYFAFPAWSGKCNGSGWYFKTSKMYIYHSKLFIETLQNSKTFTVPLSKREAIFFL